MKNPSLFINRELSWLDFDRRCLVLGKDKNVPLGEQLKFLSIYASNLDEFFMVRVGSLYDRTLLKGQREKKENKTNLTAAQQLAAIMPRVAELQAVCDKSLDKALDTLAQHGYRKVNFDRLSKEDERFWKKYFQSELYPVLSPQIVANGHPFPFLRNKDIYVGVSIRGRRSGGASLGIIPVSSQFERLIWRKTETGVEYALVEELIAHFAGMVFGKEAVLQKCLFRVTRNADITVEEGMMDHDIDNRDVMTELLKKRRKLAAVRLQFTPSAPQEIARILREKLMLPSQQIFVQSSPLDLSFLFKLYSRLEKDGHGALCYPPARPIQPPVGYDLARTVQERDVLLFYPYQSIRPFIKMLQDAAHDPSVVSIKMTLYRVAHESQIVQALVDAAENGKEVLALVELRARFDEQNNIDWSKQLENAGCTVIYGFDEYKVHSKLTLITRKTDAGYSYITQIGTGNYNEKTSELYTDLSLITTQPVIGAEAAQVFKNLAVHCLTEESSEMLVAPLRFKSVLLEEMDRVIQAARAGQPAYMILKNNAISDRDIILKLSEASEAGVQVDMIVRGICCLRAGVPGLSENIRIRSLVGRYLEHARVYAFSEGGEPRVYIASGDFLTRNTEYRVEVGVRVRDPIQMQKLMAILRAELADNVNAREMQPDGSYSRVKPKEGQPLVDSQMAMYDLLRWDWVAPTQATERAADGAGTPAASESSDGADEAEPPPAEPVGTVEEDVEEPVEEAEEAPAKESVEAPVEDAPVEIAEESPEEPVEEAAEEAIEKDAEEPVAETAEGVAEELAEEAAEEATEAPAAEVAEVPVEETAEEAAETPVEESAEAPAEEVEEEPVAEAAEEPAEEPATESTEEATEGPVEEPTETPVVEVTEEPVTETVEEPAETPLEEVAEMPAEEMAEEPVAETAEEPVRMAAPLAGEESETVEAPAEETPVEAVEEPAGEATESEEAPAGEPVAKTAEESAEGPAAEVAEVPVGETEDPPAVQPAPPSEAPATEKTAPPAQDNRETAARIMQMAQNAGQNRRAAQIAQSGPAKPRPSLGRTLLNALLGFLDEF